MIESIELLILKDRLRFNPRRPHSMREVGMKSWGCGNMTWRSWSSWGCAWTGEDVKVGDMGMGEGVGVGVGEMGMQEGVGVGEMRMSDGFR